MFQTKKMDKALYSELKAMGTILREEAPPSGEVFQCWNILRQIFLRGRIFPTSNFLGNLLSARIFRIISVFPGNCPNVPNCPAILFGPFLRIHLVAGIHSSQSLYRCRIFVNRSLHMENIKFFGFDMDYTLAGK